MKDLNDFRQMIHNHEFAEAHEVLEDRWREWKNNSNTKEESYILKGLINGATSLALNKLGRANASKQVWNTFLKYSSLIDQIESPHTKQYKECQHLLHTKYQELVTPI